HSKHGGINAAIDDVAIETSPKITEGRLRFVVMVIERNRRHRDADNRQYCYRQKHLPRLRGHCSLHPDFWLKNSSGLVPSASEPSANFQLGKFSIPASSNARCSARDPLIPHPA